MNSIKEIWCDLTGETNQALLNATDEMATNIFDKRKLLSEFEATSIVFIASLRSIADQLESQVYANMEATGLLELARIMDNHQPEF